MIIVNTSKPRLLFFCSHENYIIANSEEISCTLSNTIIDFHIHSTKRKSGFGRSFFHVSLRFLFSDVQDATRVLETLK
jgi:hypothetical protein